jgi:hypothetical protein
MEWIEPDVFRSISPASGRQATDKDFKKFKRKLLNQSA